MPPGRCTTSSSGGWNAGRSWPMHRTARRSWRAWAPSPWPPGRWVYAWALLPNHAPLLLRSGAPGLPQFMRRLLTGYALGDHRRHKRVGHLFQNRYKSIVCEEDAYFRELVRYLHLNPLRAHLAVHLVTQLSLSLADTARQLGVSTSGIAKALAGAERVIVH